MQVSVEDVHIRIPFNAGGRSPGVHVTGIIRAIAMETGILKMEQIEDLALVEIRPSMRFDDPVVALRVCMGLAWEDFYIREVLGSEGVIPHPGEYCVDGVYMSLDGEALTQVIVDNQPQHKLKVHEVKCTYKSTATVGETEGELLGQFLWLAQIKAYCKAAGTNLADLHVLFVNGNYKYPLQPVKRRFHLEFEDWEIEDNWNMLCAYRDARLGGE